MRLQLLTLDHLVQLLDPQLYKHLQQADSTNFFFFFRMLLVWYKREFDWMDVLRLWEVLWTDSLSSTFHLFIALAILEKHRVVIMEHLKQFDEILKYSKSQFIIHPFATKETAPNTHSQSTNSQTQSTLNKPLPRQKRSSAASNAQLKQSIVNPPFPLLLSASAARHRHPKCCPSHAPHPLCCAARTRVLESVAVQMRQALLWTRHLRQQRIKVM
jgi:hypothetical protein